MEDARTPTEKREAASLDELHRLRERQSLESSRRRILAELQSTQSQVYRSALENALAHLDDQLGKLG